MAHTALAAIYGLARSSCRFIRRKATCPRHLVGVDIDDADLRIYRRAAPFSSAIKSRKVDSLLVQAKRDEQPFAAERAEFIDCPCMCFRCSSGQHVFGQQLPGVWSRLERSRLCG